LVEGRPLILGGVPISHPRGLLGHSDADVVLHAVTDALLGAAGMPDIGDLFPDTDPRHKDADSRKLLTLVVECVRERGFVPGNIDIVIHAEQPRLTGDKRRIAESIAQLVRLPPDAVCVKAKSNEGLGAVGRGDAIACTAVALIQPASRQISVSADDG
jgi:2-C-methyl-D-erythritol 2,4-cyclodiphosphate synthase